MLQYSDKLLYDYSQCQQCGICEAVCPRKAISMKLLQNGLHKVVIDYDKCICCKKCVNVCPANKEYDNKSYFDSFPSKSYFLGHNSNDDIRRESSSGGVCKTLIIEGLKSGLIDGVYSLKRTATFPYAEGEFYAKDSLPSYEDVPNSIYHSVMACTHIDKIKKCHRLMIVGTACQLRALEKIAKAKCDELIRVCIFCKQQKSLDSTRFLAKVMGTSIPKNLKFSTRYRGEGWPGIVKVNGSELPWNRAAQIPFGRRLWTVPGCNVCGDPFGINCSADVTLMDPWCIEKENKLGDTLIIVHTDRGCALVTQMPDLSIARKEYSEVLPALGLIDVKRKQQLCSYFSKKTCRTRIKLAGRMEQLQRRYLIAFVTIFPRLPLICYRVICKLPDWRNLILK